MTETSPPDPKPRWSPARTYLVSAVCLVAVFLWVGFRASAPVSPPAPPRQQSGSEVTIARCGPDATADLAIVNRSSVPVTYLVTVAFLDASGVQLGTGVAAVRALQPGQRASAEAAAAVADEVARCMVVETRRS